MGGEWVQIVIGAAFVAGSFLLMRGFWGLWREGIETRATIVKAITSQLGHIRFEDQSGQDHLIENCTPPRYGEFTEGHTRPLTYLPWNPTKWEWGKRTDQRFMVMLGFYLMAIGLVTIAWGLRPLLANVRQPEPQFT